MTSSTSSSVEETRLPERLVVPGPRVLPRQFDVAGEGRETVAEARVDAAFGRVEHRDRLSTLVRVGELPPHQRGQGAAAPVRRQDAHGHHACGRSLGAPGDGRVEEVRASPADDRAAVDSGEHPLGRQDRPQALGLLGLGPVAEVVPDPGERSCDLVRRAGLDLYHYAIRSSGA
jgi:hypothetical protein